MSASTLYLTANDHRRIASLLSQSVGSADPRFRADLGRLNTDLEVATVVEPEAIPADVITINSRVVVEDLDDGDEETWLLTLPNEASVSNQRLSVLSPLGTALLGAREGEVVKWESREASGRVRVMQILFQPESVGLYNM
jgi:regulator of nucleoside diphosphate kinase